MRLSAAFLATALAFSCSSKAQDAFTAAQNAVATNDFAKARTLYAQASKDDPDARSRDRATVALANIQWRVFHEAAAARATLARVDKSSSEYASSLLERARMEGELSHDYPAARKFALQAAQAATRRGDKRWASVIAAAAVIEPLMRDRRCDATKDLGEAIQELRGVIDRDGPFISIARWLLDAALLAGDDATAAQAWRWYYGKAPQIPHDRRALGLALADAKFFREAAVVLRDRCAKEPIAKDKTVEDILAYAGALERIRDLTDEYYRTVAAGNGDKRAFQKALDKERNGALEQRFGFNGFTGTTNGVYDLHYGHVIDDQEIKVEQYGRAATLRFISVDGLISNGFLMWARDGRGGDGGRSVDNAIYQFRPMYADGPVGEWIEATDPEVRAERDRDIAEETKRDIVRAAADPLSPLHGVDMRLHRQYDDALLASLRAAGLAGDALRDAFIARVRDDTFQSSIVSHEGRHAIDQKYEHLNSEELEFRAKLSEVALSPAPRGAITHGILTPILATSPHGKANRRVYKGLVEWMAAHAAAITGLDAKAPLLPQLDRLTDDQLRAAMRAMDPLAK